MNDVLLKLVYVLGKKLLPCVEVMCVGNVNVYRMINHFN